MIPDIFRDSAAGHILQRVSRDRFASNPDERQSLSGSPSLQRHNQSKAEPDTTSSTHPRRKSNYNKTSELDQSVELIATNADSTESTTQGWIDLKDPALPYNWSKFKKLFVASEIW